MSYSDLQYRDAEQDERDDSDQLSNQAQLQQDEELNSPEPTGAKHESTS